MALSDRRCSTNRYAPPDLTPPQFRTSPEEQARLAEQAKTFPITRLPYKGRRGKIIHNLKPRKVVATETGIAFSDFQRMHVERRSDKVEQWVPDFANNDKNLRLVLAQSSWEYMLKHGRVPDDFVENLGDLEQLVEKYFEKFAATNQGEAPRRRIERTDDGM